VRVLLDTNVVLDVLLRRGEWLASAETIWEASLAGRLECCAAASAVTDVYYISRRLTSAAGARRAVEACLENLSILSVDRVVLENALLIEEDDFEDAVLIAAAVHHEVDAIVSRDSRAFAHCPIALLTPDELIARLEAGDAPPGQAPPAR